MRESKEQEIAALIETVSDTALNAGQRRTGGEPVRSPGPKKIVPQGGSVLRHAERISAIGSKRAEASSRSHARVLTSWAGEQIQRGQFVGSMAIRVVARKAHAKKIDGSRPENVALLSRDEQVASDLEVRPKRNHGTGKWVRLVRPIRHVTSEEEVARGNGI